MLKIIATCINLFLIIIIVLQIPEENGGLINFTGNNKILNSQNSAQRFLTFLTVISILIYFGIAIQLNLLDKE